MAIGGYILMTIILQVIGDYYINDYWCLYINGY